MNRYALSISLLLIAASLLTACKKGENDPFFSLRSRKARIAGEWKLDYMAYSRQSASGDTTWISAGEYTFGKETNATATLISAVSGGSTITTREYTFVLTIEKDGTYEQVQTASDGSVTTTKGTWIFLKKNKEDELKNKEAILLTTKIITTPSGTSTTEGMAGEVYVLDQLKNKDMTWKLYTKTTEGSVTETVEASLVFVQD